jgi:hypothetical protein
LDEHFNGSAAYMVVFHRVLKNMKYEEMPIKNSKGLGKKLTVSSMESLHTRTIIWFLVKRHKLALIATWAVIVTVLQVFPFVPSLLASIIGG